MSRRFRKRLVWTCIATGVLALGAGCATNDAIEEGDFADDELIEEQEGVLDPDGVGGAGDEGIREEDDEDGVIAPSEGIDDGLFEQGEEDGEDESTFEPGVGGAGEAGGDVLGDDERWDDDLEEPEDVKPELGE